MRRNSLTILRAIYCATARETHADTTTSCKELLYRISRKPDRRTDRHGLHITLLFFATEGKKRDHNLKQKRGLSVRQQLQVEKLTAGIHSFSKTFGASSKFQVQDEWHDIKDPQIFGPTVQNSVVRASVWPGFVHPRISGSPVFLPPLQLQLVNAWTLLVVNAITNIRSIVLVMFPSPNRHKSAMLVPCKRGIE
jgi:hypothetical protein